MDFWASAHVYLCVRVYECVRVCMCMCTCMYLCMYPYTYGSMCMCMYQLNICVLHDVTSSLAKESRARKARPKILVYIYIYLYLGSHFQGPGLESSLPPEGSRRQKRFLRCSSRRAPFSLPRRRPWLTSRGYFWLFLGA